MKRWKRPEALMLAMLRWPWGIQNAIIAASEGKKN